MNSKYGEISRAMRNRGIEIFILPEVQLTTQEMMTESHWLYLKDQLDNNDTDLAVLLHHSGIEDATIARQFTEFHKQVVQLRKDHGL